MEEIQNPFLSELNENQIIIKNTVREFADKKSGRM